MSNIGTWLGVGAGAAGFIWLGIGLAILWLFILRIRMMKAAVRAADALEEFARHQEDISDAFSRMAAAMERSGGGPPSMSPPRTPAPPPPVPRAADPPVTFTSVQPTSRFNWPAVVGVVAVGTVIGFVVSFLLDR